MVLAKDEVVVKDWEYAKSIVKSGKKVVETVKTLTVTNKRIVAGSKNPTRTDYEEVPLSAVKNVSVSHYQPSKLSAILMIVFGVLAMILGVVLGVVIPNNTGTDSTTGVYTSDSTNIVYMLVLVVVGIILLVKGIKNLNQGIFTLVLTTAGVQSELMSLGFFKVFRNGKKVKSETVKVKIDNTVAQEIVETIGAVILENK
ncbi:MAG: hypothetical protein IJW58_02760 [Clostridia bacterium]|nr:hypothetical protein [Clostridia bacterium]